MVRGGSATKDGGAGGQKAVVNQQTTREQEGCGNRQPRIETELVALREADGLADRRRLYDVVEVA